MDNDYSPLPHGTEVTVYTAKGSRPVWTAEHGVIAGGSAPVTVRDSDTDAVVGAFYGRDTEQVAGEMVLASREVVAGTEQRRYLVVTGSAADYFLADHYQRGRAADLLREAANLVSEQRVTLRGPITEARDKAEEAAGLLACLTLMLDLSEAER